DRLFVPPGPFFPLPDPLNPESPRSSAPAMFGCSGISTLQRESGYQKRSGAAETTWRHPMIKFTFLGVAALLSTAIEAPVFAQAVIQEPGAYAFSHPDGNLGIGSIPTQRRDVVVSRGTADAMASAPSVHTPRAGRETTTTPWSAPVGPPQRRAPDVHAPAPLPP